MQNVRRRKWLSAMMVGALGFMTAVGLFFPSASKAASDEDTKPVFTEVENLPGVNVELDLSEEFPQTGDELLMQYFEKKTQTEQPVPAQKNVRKAAPRSSRLSGNDLACYQYLKPQIEQIASGQRASSRIDVPVSAMANAAYITEFISESELGLARPCYTNVNGQWVKDEEMINAGAAAMYDLLGIDFERIVRSLMADCPYEFYWHKRQSGMSYPNVSYGRDGEGNAFFKFSETSAFTFSFMVGADYGVAGGDSYTLDTTKTAAAAAAAASVQTIVAEFSAQSDYNKLLSYKERICELVSYNNEAAGYVNSANYPYTNPWQLIYVFDADPSTNVVCEGYAKAFKFLCDRTNFRRDIECITVKGSLAVNGSGEGHMWNIVKMEDGKNYLVDVTNCDAGTIGASSQLFLQGYDDRLLNTNNDVIGFSVTCRRNAVGYVYAQETLDLYDFDAELTLADSDYEYIETVEPAFSEVALVLNGNIGVTFGVDFPEGTDPSGCRMDFLISDGVNGHEARAVSVPYADSVPVSNTSKRYFTVEISPLELADTITATLSYGNCGTLATTYQAVSYITYVQQNMAGNTELLNLVNGLYTYCYYLQFYGWDSNRYQHRPIEAPEQDSLLLSVNDVEEARAALSGYAFTNELLESGIEDTSISLTLNGRTDINVYVKPESAAVIRSAGGEERTIGTETYYRFKTLPIGPKNLGEEYTITVETSRGTATITGSALAYLNTVLNSAAISPYKQFAMTAFYRYYLAAVAYTQ